MGRPDIVLIAALAENRCIGVDGRIPWHIPADFKHFKATTMGCPLVMGRKTFESLPGLLPGRPHIVISRRGFSAPGADVRTSLEGALDTARTIAARTNAKSVFMIGGAQIYAQSLSLADAMILTHVHKVYDGDAFFPDFPADEWVAGAQENHEGNPPFTIAHYRRARAQAP